MPSPAPIFALPLEKFLDDVTGLPLAAGKVYTYAAGTSTPQATFSDSGLTSPNPNPVILDTFGKAIMYLSAVAYKIDVQNAAGQSQSGYPMDNVTGYSTLLSTGNTYTGANTFSGANTYSGAGGGLCEGRLTLTAGTPVTTADVTGATSIYFTPYIGNRIRLYDGTSVWTELDFVETALSLGTLTSGLPYDVFAYNNSGTLALESLAWTNGTTRATALVRQNGVLSKTGALTRRYLGTFYTTSTTATEDSLAKRFLWNYYNRARRGMRVLESTATWTYTTATWRQANAATGNQLDLVVGVAEVLADLRIVAAARNSSAGIEVEVGIGEDSTTALVAGVIHGVGATQVANTQVILDSQVVLYPAIGRHFYAWLEYSGATGTTTWIGNDGSATTRQSGIHGWIDG